ncbi:hypothetical protein PM082_004236 [Marasmius tenuissimus]|nr:hypothetical protein PM082_004236 [Marasmius tenuissimus]
MSDIIIPLRLLTVPSAQPTSPQIAQDTTLGLYIAINHQLRSSILLVATSAIHWQHKNSIVIYTHLQSSQSPVPCSLSPHPSEPVNSDVYSPSEANTVPSVEAAKRLIDIEQTLLCYHRRISMHW